MLMLEQIQFYIIPICACICFLAFVFIGRTTPMKKLSPYFFAVTIVILVIMLLEAIETFFDSPNYTYPSWQRWAVSMTAYILRPAIVYILILIMLRDKEKDKGFYAVTTLPLAVNTIFLLISPLCGIVYYFDDNNTFTGGPMRYLPFVVGFLYLAVYLILFIKDTRRKGTIEWAVSIPVALSCCVSVYLESACNMLGSLPLSALLGVIFYYIYIYGIQYKGCTDRRFRAQQILR